MHQPRNIAVTLECFIKKGNKYLMLHRSPQKKILPDVWMGPGGHVEFNEGLFACCRREVKEETGLAIKNLRVKAVGTAFLEDLQQEFYFHFLIADFAEGNLKQNITDGELKWLTVNEIRKHPNLLAELHKVLPFIFKNDGQVISYIARYKTGNIMTDFHLEKP